MSITTTPFHPSPIPSPAPSSSSPQKQIPSSNNLTENAIRPTKLGAKNWMFVGGEHTGWRSAVVYTFVEQIRGHGLDPFAYFEWVLDKLMREPSPEGLPGLLPTAWIKTQRLPLEAAEANIA